MKITLKDGSCMEYAEGKSVIEIAADISEGLSRVATAGEVNGEIVDLRTVLEKEHFAILLPILWHRQSRDCIQIQSWRSALLLQMASIMMWTETRRLRQKTWKKLKQK